MKVSDFHYELPQELIAQEPAPERRGSRLLRVNPDRHYGDLEFSDFTQCLEPGDLLVLNDTRVIPARLRGYKTSGGRIEILVERLLGRGRMLAQVRASKSPSSGQRLLIDGADEHQYLEVEGREGPFFVLSAQGIDELGAWIAETGHVPLPPYIDRGDTPGDAERYQTVYARHPGAVAAPTAGLHFDEEMLERIHDMGIQTTSLTLHVGAGTFQPVRCPDVSDHVMHAERITVSSELCEAVAAAKARGGRIVAVGTTVVRALESAARDGELKPYEGDTSIFIYPGFRFRIVDALLTNFHLPESTLLMLVSAFAGYELVMDSYRHAVDNRYRFFSYGDAMFVCRQKASTATLAQ